MAAIFVGFIDFAGLKLKKDDDIFDRLSRRYSVALILSCLALLTVYNNNIKCWSPLEFAGSWTKYANNFCWVNNTYYVPMEDNFPSNETHKQSQRITYFQWVPFILLLQAALFYVPSIIWHGLNQRGGIDSDDILQAANTISKVQNDDNKKRTLDLVCTQIHHFVRMKAAFHNRHKNDANVKISNVKTLYQTSRGRIKSRFTSYLSLLFLLTKVLYLTNAVVQFIYLSRLLFPGGFNNMTSFMWNKQDEENISTFRPAFPKITFCDLQVRDLGFNRPYALQCALVQNLWNERIFQVIWGWTFIVGVASLLGLIIWLLRYVYKKDDYNFIVSNHLKEFILGAKEKPSPQEDEKLSLQEEETLSLQGEIWLSPQEKASAESFVYKYLGRDGVFLLRLIAHNTNNVLTTDLIVRLWTFWENNGKPGHDEHNQLNEDERVTSV